MKKTKLSIKILWIFVALFSGVLLGFATANTESSPELPQAEVIYRINAGKVYKIKVDGVEYLIIPGSIIRHDP